MKNIIFLFLLFPVLAFSQIQTQFSAVCDFGTFTAVNDSLWQGDISNWSDPLSNGYLPSGVQVGFALVDASGKMFRVKVINSTTFSSANLNIVELQNSTAPAGRGSVFEFLPNGMIPPAVANALGVTPVIRSKIDIHNAVILSGASGGSTPLPTPTLNISVLSQSEMNLSWASVANAQLYYVERAANSGFTTEIAPIYYGAGLKFLNTGLDPNRTYYYRITALGDGYGNSSYYTANATTLSTFNPDSLSGQIAIWDLSNTSSYTTSGGKLVTLTDQSPSGNNVAPPSGERPDYFATGGPGNLPYVQGNGTTYLGNDSFPTTGSPFTIYMVVQIAGFGNGASLCSFATVNGSNGVSVLDNVTKPYNRDLSLYTGITPFYSERVQSGPRKEWMLVKITVANQTAFWIEINDEPAAPKMGGSGSISMTRMVFYQNIAHVRLFNRVPTASEDREMKRFLMNKYGLSQIKPLLIAFGDSHTSGVISGGGALLGNYIEQLDNNSIVKIYNRATSGSVVNAFNYSQTNGFNLSDKYPELSNDDFKNSWVQFQYGTNDAAIANVNSTNWDVWKRDYKSYIKAFLDAGFDRRKLIIVTPPFATTGYTEGKLPLLVPKIREIASEFGIHLYDWYAETQFAGINATTLSGGDAIHVNSAAHLLAANGLAKIITEEELQFTLPVVTTTARNDLLNPRNGQTVVNSTTSSIDYYYNGWLMAGGTKPASEISNTPSGNLAATNQQSVNNELQSDIDELSARTTVTNISLNNLDYSVSAGFRTGLLVSLQTTTGSTSDSQLQLPAADSSQEGKTIFLTSFDDDATYNVTISGGINELYNAGSYTNNLALSSSGDTKQITCVKRPSDSAYKWAIK